jgi:TP901 family phage tail tape measure protein
MPLQIPVTQTGLEASIQQAMKNAGRNAQINLGTNSRQINALAQPLGRITGQADEFTKSMEAANARVFAFGASVGIINGVTKAFSSLVKNTIEVEKSLAEINTVLNTSGDSLQKFGNKLFDVAKTTGQTFDVVAKGALELARQGLSTEETLKRINDALILSRLSGLDAQQSVEGLTAAFNSFKETGITTSQILNKLVVVSQKYSVSERDLIEGLKRSASVADQAGVSFDELVGIITTVQERTARGGAVIGNAFKTIFARIQDTGALQDLSNLGIQVTDLEGKVLPATRILQNLGAEFNNLSQLEQADIAKKLGGVYQLSNLLAAVKDLSSEQSKYNDIVKLSAGATNEAYQKNAALNEMLASLINKVSVSAQQLGATLGEIGITDSLKGLLSFFNNVLEGIQKILGEESMLGDMFRGLAKGIGNVLAGPGLALFGAIIAKLSKDLISFGIESLKSFFKIGQSAKEIASVEKSIAAALGSNLTLQRQLFALEGNRAAQLKLMTDAIVQQEAVMRRMSATAGSLAGSLYQQGVRSTGGQGLRVPQAAGGYMPAVSQESRDINRGVGGARSGDKPVVIPNFAFGGGKKGTMVAHTGEYIVPNFARGGSAIFNRDMIASMGLPSGAQKIGAAGGFIPNFQTARSSVIPEGTSPNKLRGYAAYEGDDPTSLQRKANAQKLLDQKMAKQQVKEQSRLALDASKFALLVPAIGENNQNGENFSGSFKKGSSSIPYQLKNLKIRGPQVPKAIDQAADPNDEYLKNNIENSIASDSAKYANLLGKPAKKITKVDVLRLFQTNKGSKGAISSAVGAGFEAATMAAIKTSNFTDDITAKLNKAGGDFDVRGATDDINTLFGLRGIRTMDFKSSRSSGNIDSFAKKLYNELPAALSAKVSRAASGFIPNFAKYIYDSDRIAPDKGATLKAVLASQIKKNLIIGPAGSGKSTLAGKMGKFLSGVGDVANASEIDILSGAARAKGGGISKNLEAIISAVNNSGGKVSYLYAKNLDILSRRAGRTVAEEGDLRSKKQLKGTTYAPLNQFDFMGYVKSKSRNFNLVNGAKGFIPNFADPLKEAIGREMSAGVPASQIYVDQNSSLKNSMNPMGLMVANRRDEPAGGMQGISRARKEGANPMLYGAAGGFVPNYAMQPLGAFGGSNDPMVSLEKPKKDLLGTIFLVQTGLTLLTGATSDATSGLGKFTNAIGSIASSASTALLVGQGLSGLAKEGSRAAGILGKVGIAGAVLAGGFEAFKAGIQIWRDATGRTAEAAKATAKFNDAVAAAGISLDNLSQSEVLKRTKSAESSLSNLGAGISLTDDIFGRAYKDPELKKMYAETVLQTGLSEKDIQQKLFEAKAVDKIEYKRAYSNKLETEYTNFDPDKFKQVMADLVAMPEKMVDGKINPEYEKRIARITELKQKQAQVEKDINEPARIAEAKEAISSQVKETLKLIRAQELLNARKLGEKAVVNQAEVNNQQRILAISSDLTLSQTQRAKKLAEQENTQARITAELEAQSQIADKLDESLSEISKGGLQFGAITDKKQIEEAVNKSKEFVKNISETPKAAGAISSALQGNSAELENLIKGSTQLGEEYKGNAEYIKLMTTAILQFTQGEKNILNLLDQEESRRNKLYDISVKTKQNEEDRAAIAERVNYQLESRASALDFQGQGVSNKQQINQARKELETAVYERTALTTTVEDYKKGLDEINRKYFDLEMAAQKEKAALEIKSEITRGLKVDQNNLKLDATTIALDNLKGTTETATEELKKLPAGIVEAMKQQPVYGQTSNMTLSPYERAMTAAGSVNNVSGPAKSNISNIQYSLGKNRPNKPNESLIAEISKVVRELYGDQAMVTITSGKGEYGTRRHRGGEAADLLVQRGGKTISGEELAKLGAYWVTQGKGSAGYGMSGGSVIHLDSFTRDKLTGNEGLSWGYGGGSGALLNKLINQMGGVKGSPVNQATQQLNTQQFGLSDKAYAEAIKIATLDINKIGDAAYKAAEGLKGANAPAEEITQLAEVIKNAAIKFKSTGATEEFAREQNRLQKLKEAEAEMPKTFSKGWSDAITNINKDVSNFQYELGQAIPTLFSNNLSQGIQDAITGAKSLEDALVSAASSFVQEIQSMAIKNLANQFTSSFSGFLGFSSGSSVPKYASGGMINGGSGSKDDVPAMLMGGEYVVKKTAVQKYGPEFLSAINNGTLGGYAKGGQVQTGQGGFYTPGTYGKGGIQGRQNLLDFATQTATSGQYDVIRGGDNYASINLEAESMRLTNFGRSRGPMADALRSAKEESFGLYQQDVEAEKQRREQQKQLDEQSKAMKKQLLISVGSMVASSALSAGASGFQSAFGAAKAGGAGTLSSFGSGLKGIFTGASATGGVNVGGLNNWFTGIGKGLTGNFSDAANYFKLSQMGSLDKLGQAYSMGVGPDGKTSSFNKFLDKSGYIPRAFPVNPTEPSVGSNGIFNWFKPMFNRASGGIIPPTSGIDTVPAMLSGGEFIMNRAASQNIGAGNLQSLNAGASSLPTEEKTEELNDRLVAKLDELIATMTEGGGSGAITINVDSNGKSTQETSGESSESRQKLAAQIKDTVMKVIEQEKRLGGKLRRGLT